MEAIFPCLVGAVLRCLEFRDWSAWRPVAGAEPGAARAPVARLTEVHGFDRSSRAVSPTRFQDDHQTFPRSRTVGCPLRSTRESDDWRPCSQPERLDLRAKRAIAGFLVWRNVSDRRVPRHP